MQGMLMLCLASGASALSLSATTARAPAAATRHAVPRMDATEDRIKELIEENKVMLFMKGNKNFPQCGFSNTAVMILKSIPAAGDFGHFDVLSDNDMREGIKKYSAWPTIPQCYIDGEFIGGCDLLIEMYQSGELQEMVEKAAAS